MPALIDKSDPVIHRLNGAHRRAMRRWFVFIPDDGSIAWMNLHHLELFYYVARHGGISRAVRAMPYGIQQPAVSSQVLALEQDLNTKLFERQPFRLTPEGQELYDFARPFFDEAAALGNRMRDKHAPRLRIAASELILRDYLPVIIKAMKERHPSLRFGLKSGSQAQIEQWLQERHVDLAITPIYQRPASGLECMPIVKLPLVLLAPKSAKAESAEQLWARTPLLEPLIGMPAVEVITRTFCEGLKKKNIDWPIEIEAPSVDLITQYVANGYGYGVTVALPQLVKHPLVRVIALQGFDPVEVVALWRPPVTPLHDTLRSVIQVRARELWPGG